MSEPETEKPKKAPRKDRGTKRVSLPTTLAKRIEEHAADAALSPEKFLGRLLANYEAEPQAIALPLAVQSRLAAAADGSGRTISELLGDMEADLVLLPDGGLLRRAPTIPGEGPEAIPSLEDRLVAAFRERLRAVKVGE